MLCMPRLTVPALCDMLKDCGSWFCSPVSSQCQWVLLIQSLNVHCCAEIQCQTWRPALLESKRTDILSPLLCSTSGIKCWLVCARMVSIYFSCSNWRVGISSLDSRETLGRGGLCLEEEGVLHGKIAFQLVQTCKTKRTITLNRNITPKLESVL